MMAELPCIWISDREYQWSPSASSHAWEIKFYCVTPSTCMVLYVSFVRNLYYMNIHDPSIYFLHAYMKTFFVSVTSPFICYF